MFVIVFILAWLVATVLISALVQVSSGSYEPAESMAKRRALWLAVNALGMGTHAWFSSRMGVSRDLVSAGIYSRGPGEGLYFFCFLVLPWLVAMGLNIPVACSCARSRCGALALWLAVLCLWFLLFGLEDALWPTCPEGVRCVAS